MKKIGILTVHKGTNIGSFLQAYALKTAIEKEGCDVKLIDNRSRLPKRTMLSTVKNNIIGGKIGKALFSYKLFSTFIKAFKGFDEIPMSKADSLDCVVLGSDEIWNVKRKVMSDYPSFFGVGISTKKIAYSPSVNNANAEDMKKDYIINALNDISSISVRDTHSSEVIKEITGRSTPVTCDPTWLLTPDEYPIADYKINEKYILVYMYNSSIEDEEIKAMRSLADEQGLKLIAVNNYLKWCDSIITVSPFEYLSVLKGAEFALTNTFHGTILSILFNKCFASFEKNNRKISEMLDLMSLSQRKINNGADNLNEIFATSPDWESVNDKINTIRKASADYLSKALGYKEII